MNLARTNINTLIKEMGLKIHRIFLYEVKFFCCNVLIEAPGRRLDEKIINPSKILTMLKLMYSYGRNEPLFTP